MFKSFVLPLCVAISVGLGSSYLSTRDALLANQGEMSLLKNELSQVEAIVSIVRQNQLTLATRGEWMKKTDLAIEIIREELNVYRTTRYTDKDSQRDLKIIRMEIQQLKEMLDSMSTGE